MRAAELKPAEYFPVRGTAEQAAEKVENDVFRVIQNASENPGRAYIEFKRDIFPSISEFATF
ncbi:MAG: hypothetical protein WA655_24970, partial [Candidatus Korobacteraceae bacterium]